MSLTTLTAEQKAQLTATARAADLNLGDILAELVSRVTALESGDGTIAGDKAFSGDLALAGALTATGGDADGEVVLRLGDTATEGVELVVVDTVINPNAIGGVTACSIPAGAVLLSVQANVTVALVSGGTTAALGFGTGADPDLYGKTDGLTKNTKLDHQPGWANVSDSFDIVAFPIELGGDIGDTGFSAGSVRVRVVYLQLNSLDDA